MAPKSKVWVHFTRNRTNTLCNLCGKCVVSTNTTNLWSHLKSKHEKEYICLSNSEDTVNLANILEETDSRENQRALVDANSQKSTENSEKDNQSNGTLILSQTNSTSSVQIETSNKLVPYRPAQIKQSTLGNRFNKLSKTDCEKIGNAIAYFIAVANEPYSITENNGFRHLLGVLAPSYPVPTRKVFSDKKIPALYAATKKIMTTKVRDIEFFGLTTDGWTAPNSHKFFALTCSYIDDDWILNTHCLACRELNIKNSGVNIKNLIMDILAEYKMENKQFPGVTTDRGSNCLTAVDLLDMDSIPCFAHAINTKMEEMLKLRFIAPTLAKIKSIYATISYSPKAKQYLAICQAEINLPQNKMPSTSQTRWWSEIDQFKFVVSNELALYKFVTNYPDMDLNLVITADDINRIKAILLVMEPMQKYVTTLGSEKIVTASIIPPLIGKLDKTFGKFKYNDVVASFEIRKFFGSIPKFLNDLYIKEKTTVEMATYLDPRFKGARRADLDLILEMDVNQIIASKAAAAAAAAAVNSSSSKIERGEKKKEKRKTALEELFEEDEDSNDNSLEDVAKAEINLYHSQLKINIDESPLMWWKSRSAMLPNVSIVAKKYLCLSATSVLSERIFSEGKRVMTKDRFRITDEHYEQLIFLNMNEDLVPKNPLPCI